MAAKQSIARAGRLLTSLPMVRSHTHFPSSLGLRPRPQFQAQRPRPFSVSSQLAEKRYTEEHEWVELGSEGNICTLGISQYAAKALGDITYVELPEISLELGKNDAVGAVESVKSASDILTPVSGKVVEANAELEERPQLLNEDPEGAGWIAKIEVEHPEELEKLMDEEGYKKYTGELES